MTGFPPNIFAEFWCHTGGYRTREKASKRQSSPEMLRKQRPSGENLVSKCFSSLLKTFTRY